MASIHPTHWLSEQATGLKELPTNAAWLLSKAAHPVKSAGSSDEEKRSEAVDTRMARAREAAEDAQEREGEALRRAEEAQRRSEHARQVSEQAREKIGQAEKEAKQMVAEREGEAKRKAQEMVESARQEAREKGDDQIGGARAGRSRSALSTRGRRCGKGQRTRGHGGGG